MIRGFVTERRERAWCSAGRVWEGAILCDPFGRCEGTGVAPTKVNRRDWSHGQGRSEWCGVGSGRVGPGICSSFPTPNRGARRISERKGMR
jgi:hypothetical protein